jgi:hypothetical protein
MKSGKKTKCMVILFLILWIGPLSVGAISLLMESKSYEKTLGSLIAGVQTFRLTSPMITIGLVSFFPFVFFASLYAEQKKHKKFLEKCPPPKKDDRKQEALRRQCHTQWEKQQKERKKIFEQNKMTLESGPHKKLIERFVATNRSIWCDIDKLKQLLYSKGIDFNYTEMDLIIAEERKKQEYKNFKRTFIDNDLNDLRDYILDFLDSYGEQYGEHMDFFIRLLKEQKIDVDKDKIEDHIKNIIKEIDLEKYENQLFHR